MQHSFSWNCLAFSLFGGRSQLALSLHGAGLAGKLSESGAGLEDALGQAWAHESRSSCSNLLGFCPALICCLCASCTPPRSQNKQAEHKNLACKRLLPVL